MTMLIAMTAAVFSLNHPRVVLPPHTYAITLVWTASPGTNVGGYYASWGVASRTYTNKVTALDTNVTIPGFRYNTTYFFAVQAYDLQTNQNLLSDFSNEISYRNPPWSNSIVTVSAGNNGIAFTNPVVSPQFYRLRGNSWTGSDLLASQSLRGPWVRVTTWNYASNRTPSLSITRTNL